MASSGSRKSKAIEGWPQLLDFVNEQYRLRKGRAYPWQAKDAAMLRKMCRWYSVPEMMALYKTYIKRSSFFGPKSGYLVSGMLAEHSALLDWPDFKELKKAYESVFNERTDAQIVLEFGLRGKAL